MFMLNNLVGFGSGSLKSEVQVDRTTGTVIGDMTTTAAIANVFDGDTTQSISGGAGPCPIKGSTGNGYVGKTHVVGKIISRVKVYGSDDTGFDFNANGSITITLYGKNGTPSNGTDGTAIGSTTFTDTSNESAGRDITSTNQTTSYTSYWVYIVGGGGNSIGCAELEVWELA